MTELSPGRNAPLIVAFGIRRRDPELEAVDERGDDI
jgi:hypothetical protein